jgi:hypothetical protein
VQVEQVQVVGAQALQAGLAAAAGVLGPAVGGLAAIGQREVAELGRDHGLAAAAAQRGADPALVQAVPVGVGGVEEVDAQLQRAVHQRRERLLRAGAEILRAHAVAQGQCGHPQAAGTEEPLFHVCLSPGGRLLSLPARPLRRSLVPGCQNRYESFVRMRSLVVMVKRMNLQQLRYLAEVAARDLNLSRAADALHTSQPGISRQIRLLEEELGTELLVRQGNRIAALTQPGREAVEIARRALREIENLRTLGEDASRGGQGRLVIATTHAHARYILIPIVRAYQAAWPDVSLGIRQGHPDQIVDWVQAGEADIGLCTDPTRPCPSWPACPATSWRAACWCPTATRCRTSASRRWPTWRASR